MMKKFMFLMIAFLFLTNPIKADDDPENADALKCIAKYLKDKGIHEEALDSVDTSSTYRMECDRLRAKKLEKGFNKIETKLRSDDYFLRYADCIMKGIKTQENENIILRREALKIQGVGIAVWNYFSQREKLDDLKKDIEKSINKSAQNCIM